jgi:ureidoglycolate lyase
MGSPVRERVGLGVSLCRAEPLSAAAFAPFGQLITEGAGPHIDANQGTATRVDRAALLEHTRPDATPNLAVFRAKAQTLPLKLALLERHPHSTQAFLPLSCARFLVCVAPTAADGKPELAGLRAFLGGVGQGINYSRGVWHHPIVALDEDAVFAMLAWENGSAGDCEVHALTELVSVS